MRAVSSIHVPPVTTEIAARADLLRDRAVGVDEGIDRSSSGSRRSVDVLQRDADVEGRHAAALTVPTRNPSDWPAAVQADETGALSAASCSGAPPCVMVALSKAIGAPLRLTPETAAEFSSTFVLSVLAESAWARPMCVTAVEDSRDRTRGRTP